jgi:hypothetical protein
MLLNRQGPMPLKNDNYAAEQAYLDSSVKPDDVT